LHARRNASATWPPTHRILTGGIASRTCGPSTTTSGWPSRSITNARSRVSAWVAATLRSRLARSVIRELAITHVTPDSGATSVWIARIRPTTWTTLPSVVSGVSAGSSATARRIRRRWSHGATNPAVLVTANARSMAHSIGMTPPGGTTTRGRGRSPRGGAPAGGVRSRVMSLADRRWLRLFTLCALYCAQGIPWGFMAITLPAYLAGKGLDTAAVGSALAMTTLPFTFKWVWGPIVDAFTWRRFGRRRPWILFAQAMMALTVGALIAIPDLTQDLDLLMWMVLIHTVFNALQDVAVDALAVDLLDEEERGRANGLMYASKYGGGVIGGAGMATVIGFAGLRTALTMQVVILLAIMLVPLLVRERDGAPPPTRSIGEILVGLRRAFSLRSAIVLGVLMLGATFATGIVNAAAPALYMQHLGWKDTEYAQLAGGPVLLIGLGGAVLGGLLADKVGHRRLAAIASVVMALWWIGFALAEPWWHSRAFIFAVMWVEPLCLSLMTVALFALCMDVSWPRIAATQFTAYMAMSNMSTTRGYQVAGRVVDAWGYQGMFVAAAVIQLVVTLSLLLIDPHQTRRVLGES